MATWLVIYTCPNIWSKYHNLCWFMRKWDFGLLYWEIERSNTKFKIPQYTCIKLCFRTYYNNHSSHLDESNYYTVSKMLMEMLWQSLEK